MKKKVKINQQNFSLHRNNSYINLRKLERKLIPIII